MAYKYEIYCNTDSKWEYLWNDIDPGITSVTNITECPTNVEHSINLNSITNISTISKNIQININKNIKTKYLSTTVYKEIANFIFEGSNIVGKFINCKIISYMNEHTNTIKGDSGFDYTIRIYDKTNRTVISTQFISGDPLQRINTCTTGSNIPTEEAIFSIQILLGSNGGNIHMDNIEILFKI